MPDRGNHIERRLWIAFGILFIGMVSTAWLPTYPLIGGLLPFWSVVVLALLGGSAAVAALAVVRYDWPRMEVTR